MARLVSVNLIPTERNCKMKKQNITTATLAMTLAIGLTGYTIPTYGDTSSPANDTGPVVNLDYSKMKKAFEEAEPAKASDIVGWMSGWCFDKEREGSENYVEASVLTGFLDLDRDGKHTFRTFLDAESEGATYYDTARFDVEKAQAVLEEAQAIVKRFSMPSHEANGSLRIVRPFDGETNVRMGTVGSGADTYLLAKHETGFPLVEGFLGFKMKERYCYYFMKKGF